MKHSKTFHNLYKNITQAKTIYQVGAGKNSTSLLYSETKTVNFFSDKNAKITKWSHAYKYYKSTYDTEVSNSFNPEL